MSGQRVVVRQRKRPRRRESDWRLLACGTAWFVRLDLERALPGCGGVLDVAQTLKSVHKEAYDCALCATGYEPTLDEMVEVAFTVNPRVRRIKAHDPHSLPPWEYFRQIFWGSGVDLPEAGFDY